MITSLHCLYNKLIFPTYNRQNIWLYIALLTETWLSVHDTLNEPVIQELRNSGYKITHIARKNTTRNGGGVAILTKTNQKFKKSPTFVL